MDTVMLFQQWKHQFTSWLCFGDNRLGEEGGAGQATMQMSGDVTEALPLWHWLNQEFMPSTRQAWLLQALGSFPFLFAPRAVRHWA